MTHEHRWVVFAGPFPQRQNSTDVRYHEYRMLFALGCQCGARDTPALSKTYPWERRHVREALDKYGLIYDTTNP